MSYEKHPNDLSDYKLLEDCKTKNDLIQLILEREIDHEIQCCDPTPARHEWLLALSEKIHDINTDIDFKTPLSKKKQTE